MRHEAGGTRVLFAPAMVYESQGMGLSDVMFGNLVGQGSKEEVYIG